MHRAKLAKIVRGVVVASSLVCLAALGRIAVAHATTPAEEAEFTPPHAGAAMRDGANVVATIEKEIDSLTARTRKALHVEERRASAHLHGASRRFEW
jgi:hypothetical protein